MDIKDHAADYAKELMNNHASFTSFGWEGRPEDAEKVGIYYYLSRDSRLLEESNAAVLEEVLDPYTGSLEDGEDIEIQSHGHWACGWIQGFVVRVEDDKGEFTPGFLKLVECLLSLADYPVLSDEDYSEREYNATLVNIGDYSRLTVEGIEEGWESAVFSCIWDIDETELENCDDQGGYPSEEVVVDALARLGMLDMDEHLYSYENGSGIYRGLSEDERRDKFVGILETMRCSLLDQRDQNSSE